jgi:outer membrane protein OmpA-like peptidoglycan-associated protein
MSITWRIILLLLLWLAYSIFILRQCSDRVCEGCGAVEAGVVPPVEEETKAFKRYPIDFSYSDATPNRNAGYDSLRAAVLSQMTEDNILEINGLYYEGEEAPEGAEGMGLARAERLKQLFLPDVAEDRIRLRARTISGEPVREGYFPAHAFKWVDAEKPAAGDMLVELLDRIIIRFPFNSTEKDYDPKVDEYLTELAGLLKESDENLRIVGHTDNKGTPEYNQRLGRNRALAIAGILTGQGVDERKLIIESKGETQPVASNETEEGRHNNRRVELYLLDD